MSGTQQRAELHKAIWALANELRGSVDGWDFKQYVLGTLFYRYISEDMANYINERMRKAGLKDFNYEAFDDESASLSKDEIVAEKGIFIKPSQLFVNICKNARKDENLNTSLENAFKDIEASAIGTPSESDFKGLFEDIDVNSNKLGDTVAKRNAKLVKILETMAGLNLGLPSDHNIDVFGDAYEFLMSMYAANAGKSGGEFFTPQEASRLLALIVTHGKDRIRRGYDPASGSASLLLQLGKVKGFDKVDNFYGQEINRTTYNLSRINMFLHGVPYDRFDIACEDTLLHPQHWDEQPMDAIVSNYPYSIKWIGEDDPTLINDPRFAPAGVLAPKSKADLAFLMHITSWLSADGTAAVVSFPGVLYRGASEAKIRKYLVESNYIDTVIQLPDNLFFGTSIATCIIVIKKNKKEAKTLFIDASKEFIHEGNKNKLSEDNIQNILNEWVERKQIPHFSKEVDNSVIAENDYNLSVSTYVEQEDTKEKIDIVKLNAELKEIVQKENALRAEIDKIIAELD